MGRTYGSRQLKERAACHNRLTVDGLSIHVKMARCEMAKAFILGAFQGFTGDGTSIFITTERI